MARASTYRLLAGRLMLSVRGKAGALLTTNPAFGVYLLAIGLLPFRWLSPIGSLQEHAIWSDVLLAVAAVLWLAQKVLGRGLVAVFRAWQLPLASYLLLACLSAALAVPGRGGGWGTVLLMVELAAVAVVTADFASDRWKRRVIARVVVASAIATVVLGAVGVILFYAHVRSGLVGAYGDLTPSRLYARVQAGFESPPLLASYCIFASGIAASEDVGLSRPIQLATQVSLGLLCVATVSRGLVGFILALILRRSAAAERRRGFLAVGALAASLGIMALLSVGTLHLNPTNPSTASYTAAAGGRHQAFVSSLKAFEQHPLVGVGPGALPGTAGNGPVRAHFTPLNVAATLGLPAFCALVAAFWLLWRSRRRPTNVALWSALAGIGLDGLGQDIDHFRHVWVLIGLLSGGRPRSRTGIQPSVAGWDR